MFDKKAIEEYKNQLTKMTDDFCDHFLDQEYKDLCQRLIQKMARKRIVPFLSGKIEIWAASIIYTLGSLNFLFDPSTKPYISTDDLCNYFGTSKSTTAQKAKTIKDMFRLSAWDWKSKEFLTKRLIEANPFFGSNVYFDGIPIPLDSLPEELKEIAEANPNKRIAIWTTKETEE